MSETDPQIELFEKAVEEHTPRLISIARAIVGTRAAAEDVVQQALTNLYQHRARYDWNQPGPLLRRTVVNESLRLVRQRRPEVLLDETPAESETPVSRMISQETVTQVRKAINQLPENFRAALVLCEYEKLSYVEIAQALNASVPQVKTWIFRARRQLAHLLKNVVQSNERIG